MDDPTQYSLAVAGELRAQMARQQKSIADLAQALGLRDPKSARLRYDGHKSMTSLELARAAEWLGIDRSVLVNVVPVAVAS